MCGLPFTGCLGSLGGDLAWLVLTSLILCFRPAFLCHSNQNRLDAGAGLGERVKSKTGSDSLPRLVAVLFTGRVHKKRDAVMDVCSSAVGVQTPRTSV